MAINVDDPRLALHAARFKYLREVIEWATEERDSLICRLYDANPELCNQKTLAKMNKLSQPGISGIVARGRAPKKTA